MYNVWRSVRIEELLNVLERSAKAHWHADDPRDAAAALERWYSALRELSEIDRRGREPRTLAVRAGSNN